MAGVKLRAECRGDELILNGEKTFTANGKFGKLFFIDVRTDPNAPLREGTTMFLVPRYTPGFRTGKVYDKTYLIRWYLRRLAQLASTGIWDPRTRQ